MNLNVRWVHMSEDSDIVALIMMQILFTSVLHG